MTDPCVGVIRALGEEGDLQIGAISPVMGTVTMDEKRLDLSRRAPKRSIAQPLILCNTIHYHELTSVVLGIILGTYLCHFATPDAAIDHDCPASLPLDPIHRHPVLPNDTRLAAAEKELSELLHSKLSETDSAVIAVVHGGQTILEWSYGRIRSNLSAEEDDRKVGADTIWRVASITKVIELEGNC
jgi:Beta-lactamase